MSGYVPRTENCGAHCDEQYRLPNLSYSWRHMPLRAAAWDLAWWLLRRVAMRHHTGHQVASMLDSALGHFRSSPPLWPYSTSPPATSGSSNVTVRWTHGDDADESAA